MDPRRPRPALRRHGASWWLRSGHDPSRAAEIIEAAWKLHHAGAKTVKQTRQKSIYLLDLANESRPTHVLKAFRYTDWTRFSRRLRGSKAYRELRISEELLRRGVRTPDVVAAGEFYRGPGLEECWLLSAFVEGAQDLAQLPELGSAQPARELARSLGSFCRDLYEAGLLQGDLAPNNILRDPQGQLWITDFERARLRRHVDDRARWQELARFERYLARSRVTDRAHFLQAFSRGEFLEARRHWAGISREIRRMARRDAAHALRVSNRDGRRYRGLAFGDWQGHVARGFHAADFAASLGRGGAVEVPTLGSDAGYSEKNRSARGPARRRPRRVFCANSAWSEPSIPPARTATS
jgi:tRNA A-37 threonylcarbamoyl transferase component Bud32